MNEAQQNQARFHSGQLRTALRANEVEQARLSQEIEYLTARNVAIEERAQHARDRNQTVPPDLAVGQTGIVREIAVLNERRATLQSEAEAIRAEAAAVSGGA